MKHLRGALANKVFIRYVVVGGSVYLLEVLIIIMGQHSGLSQVAAVGLAFWCGLIVSFALQKLVAFQDHRRQRHVVVSQLAAFSLLVLFNFGFTLLATYLLQSFLPAAVTRTLALGVTTVWNFYLYRTRIFTSNAPL